MIRLAAFAAAFILVLVLAAAAPPASAGEGAAPRPAAWSPVLPGEPVARRISR